MSTELLRSGEAPSIVRSTSLDRGAARSFLSDVVIEHGPRDILGRLFLRADTGLREQGVLVSFTDCRELVQLNKENPENWSPILPLFDPAQSDVDDSNCVAVIGRNASGKPVFAHASRLYRLGAGNIKDEIDSLRLFYRDPERSAMPGESLVCSATMPSRLGGNAVFGGAMWLHPNYRGKEMMRYTSPLIRALAFTRWDPTCVFSFMVPQLVKAGVAAKIGLNHEFEVTMTNTPVKRGGVINAAFIWITHAEQIDLFGRYFEPASTGRDAKVDGGVVERAGDRQASA